MCIYIHTYIHIRMCIVIYTHIHMFVDWPRELSELCGQTLVNFLYYDILYYIDR